MPTKKKIIAVPSGSVDRICKELNCGRTTVYEALRFNCNTAQAHRIRNIAINEYGGVQQTKVYFP